MKVNLLHVSGSEEKHSGGTRCFILKSGEMNPCLTSKTASESSFSLVQWHNSDRFLESLHLKGTQGCSWQESHCRFSLIKAEPPKTLWGALTILLRGCFPKRFFWSRQGQRTTKVQPKAIRSSFPQLASYVDAFYEVPERGLSYFFKDQLFQRKKKKK